MLCYIISTLCRGLLYCVTIIQECSCFHYKRTHISREGAVSYRHLERKGDSISNDSACLFQTSQPALQSTHACPCTSPITLLISSSSKSFLILWKVLMCREKHKGLGISSAWVDSQFTTR